MGCFLCKSKKKGSSKLNARPVAAKTKEPAAGLLSTIPGKQFRTSTPLNLLATPLSVPAVAEGPVSTPVVTPDIVSQPSASGQIPPAQSPTLRSATPPAQDPTLHRNPTPPAQTPTVLAQTPTSLPENPTSSGNVVAHGYIYPRLVS